ncbi:hypothetical protein ACLB2K_059749 [Fragaria x ananassa]
MADRREGLEDTPTWAVSVFALFIFILSFIIDDGIHRLTKFLKSRRRKSLNRALKKFKTGVGFSSVKGRNPAAKHPYISLGSVSCSLLHFNYVSWDGQDPRRFQHPNQTPFVKRHLKIWSKHPLLLWPVCFARQFGGSISKVDYMTLRNGFIVIVLLVGTKLQVVITKMCAESCKENPVIRGSFVIEYGHNSCFNRRTKDVIIKITMGIVVQLICGYVTLPLYALVTQMGSGMKKAVFTELVVDGLKNWHKNARRRLSKNGSTASRKSSNSAQLYSTDDASVTDSECSYKSPKPTIVRSSSSTSEIIQDHVPPGLTSYTECSYKTPKPTITRSSSTSEIIEEQAPTDLTTKSETTSLPTREITREEENPNIMNKVLYDGEISFGSSWKLKLESVSKRSGEITSIIEEEVNFDK